MTQQSAVQFLAFGPQQPTSLPLCIRFGRTTQTETRYRPKTVAPLVNTNNINTTTTFTHGTYPDSPHKHSASLQKQIRQILANYQIFFYEYELF
jgi:hypothetical protein